jgi:hypothetical protein
LTALRFFHVDTPWTSILAFSGRLGFPTRDPVGRGIDLEFELRALALQRHKCAHVASHKVTTVWLRAVPDQILRYAISFDCLASCSTSQIALGHPDFLQDDKWMTGNRLSIRAVRQRKDDWAEMADGGKRATNKGKDPVALLAAAAARCGPLEVLVQQATTGAILTWAVPAVE